MHRRIVPTLGLLALLAVPVALVAQTPPPPTVSTVTITSPQGTAADPFRSSNPVIALDFTSDATNGAFHAVSMGADIPMGIFLFNGGGGRVGAGFQGNSGGIRALRVSVTSAVGTVPVQASASSAPVHVVHDVEPPRLQILQIQVSEVEGFVPYQPGKVYHANANQILMRGRVDDGPTGTPAEEIEVLGTGGTSPASAQADSSGAFELSIDVSTMDEGPMSLEVLARDRMSDGSPSNESRSRLDFGTP